MKVLTDPRPRFRLMAIDGNLFYKKNIIANLMNNEMGENT
jgi:hypothetical protein